MNAQRILCLLIASLLLSACAVSPPLLTPPTRPPLDSKLAEPCATLEAPDAADYDVIQEWVQDKLLRSYGECAGRHRAAIEAWPK